MDKASAAGRNKLSARSLLPHARSAASPTSPVPSANSVGAAMASSELAGARPLSPADAAVGGGGDGVDAGASAENDEPGATQQRCGRAHPRPNAHGFLFALSLPPSCTVRPSVNNREPATDRRWSPPLLPHLTSLRAPLRGGTVPCACQALYFQDAAAACAKAQRVGCGPTAVWCRRRC